MSAERFGIGRADARGAPFHSIDEVTVFADKGIAAGPLENPRLTALDDEVILRRDVCDVSDDVSVDGS